MHDKSSKFTGTDLCLQRLASFPRSWRVFSSNFGILAFFISKKDKICLRFPISMELECNNLY